MMIYFTQLVALKSPYKKVVFGILHVHASWMEKLEMMVLSLVNEKMIILRIKLWKLISVLILPVVIQPITHAKRLVFFVYGLSLISIFSVKHPIKLPSFTLAQKPTQQLSFSPMLSSTILTSNIKKNICIFKNAFILSIIAMMNLQLNLHWLKMAVM